MTCNDNGILILLHFSCCCNHRFSPCVLWTSFCSWFVHVLERFFGWFGEGIAKHPLLTIPLCLVFVSICSVGFAWMNVENRTEKLFIPQNSKAMEDLNAAEKYFPVRFREEIVLLVASSDPPNVINRGCLEQALEVHQAVVELKSYSELCLTLSGVGAKNPKECVMINPLEIFQFDKGNLNRTDSQLQEKVSKEYTNTMNPQAMSVMRNGRSFRYNFERMFGKVEKEGENIIGAQALQMIYYMRDPSDKDSNAKILEWEKTFVDKLQSLVGKHSCFAVHFSSERSLDDAIAESSGSDVTLVSITFTLMITFACVMLGKFMNPLTGHSLLANAGVFAVALGILAGFGLAMWCRVPFVSLVGVLPFLILGIGIDDMFILVDELDRQQRSMTVVETVKEVLSRSGATITMTTLTDLVAFAVSTSTSFPAIR